MTIRGLASTLGLRAIRWLKYGALILTTAALLLCLQFVLQTNALTVFLFSSLAPGLVMASMAAVVTALFLEYRLAHSLFDIESVTAGHIVFLQGEPGDCAYFIREGEVEVIDEANHEVLARLGPHEYFGEMALLADAPRNATVRVVSDVELARLGKENFLNLLKLLPTTEEEILATVRNRAMGIKATPPREPAG